jgi:hypothetical protein
MAVPSSGTLSMLDIAQECKHGTYGSGSITGPISMYNLINGGNTGGAVTSGETYPSINSASTAHPLDANFVLLTTVVVNIGGEAPGACNTSLQMHDNTSLNSAQTVYVRGDLDGTGKTNSTFSKQHQYYETTLTASVGGATIDRAWERLAKVHTFNTPGTSAVYYEAGEGGGYSPLANGTYYISFAGANSNGLYTCTGPGNVSLKIKVVITNNTTVQTNELGN